MTIKYLLVLSAFLLIGSIAFCQNTLKTNPIVFAELYGGYAYGSAGGFSGGASINLQVKQHLFTLRQAGAVKFRSEFGSRWLPIPRLEQISNYSETSMLYGWRFVENKRASSFSLGVSYNVFSRHVKEDNSQQTVYNLGVPFEANIKWFKSRRERLKLYGIIAICKPSGLNASFGFKMFGNIARYSNVGAGIVVGMGWHKKY